MKQTFDSHHLPHHNLVVFQCTLLKAIRRILTDCFLTFIQRMCRVAACLMCWECNCLIFKILLMVFIDYNTSYRSVFVLFVPLDCCSCCLWATRAVWHYSVILMSCVPWRQCANYCIFLIGCVPWGPCANYFVFFLAECQEGCEQIFCFLLDCGSLFVYYLYVACLYILYCFMWAIIYVHWTDFS